MTCACFVLFLLFLMIAFRFDCLGVLLILTYMFGLWFNSCRWY